MRGFVYAMRNRFAGISVLRGHIPILYCSSVIVGSRVYSNTLATLFADYPTEWTVKRAVVGTSVLAVL